MAIVNFPVGPHPDADKSLNPNCTTHAGFNVQLV